MGLKIYWSEFSKNELKSIFDYYKINISFSVSKNIVKNISESVKILSTYPEIGPIDPEFESYSPPLRYLISSNYKILYWVLEDLSRIEILDVFDTRQNPIKIKRNK